MQVWQEGGGHRKVADGRADVVEAPQIHGNGPGNQGAPKNGDSISGVQGLIQGKN